MNIKQRLNKLREKMEVLGINGYIIEGTDPHLSEYPASRWETRSWITGFTGSAGIVVVTLDEAHLWVDPRYHLQAEEEIAGNGIILHKVTHPGPGETIPWISSNLGNKMKLGLNRNEISLSAWRTYDSQLADYGIKVELVDGLCSQIWEDRPAVPAEEVFEVSPELAGVRREEKLGDIREYMERLGASWYILSSLDDIAWVLNIRGRDVAYNPLCISYLFIGSDRAILCIDEAKIPLGIRKELNSLEIAAYEQAPEVLKRLLSRSSGKVLLDPARTSMLIAQPVISSCPIVERPDITSLMKAKKNPAELSGMADAHIQDGAAMVSFLCWLEKHGQVGTWSEVTLAEELLQFRKQREGFYQESFSPIFGFRSHGAIIHYHAKEPEAYLIDGSGLMIIDSGGQYYGGTTDITRTVLFGEPEPQAIYDYTLVLKGHLKLSSTPFPVGTRGFQLDTLARQFLWEALMHYGHGTGHGIGHMLCVHEGPGSISTKPIDIAVEEGMVFSNEPGIYREGEYGIRIENLIYAVKGEDRGFGQFLVWNTLTLCPYERDLIDTSMLTPEEISQVDAYHQRVYDELSGLLNEEEALWLKEKTRRLNQ